MIFLLHVYGRKKCLTFSLRPEDYSGPFSLELGREEMGLKTPVKLNFVMQERTWQVLPGAYAFSDGRQNRCDTTGLQTSFPVLTHRKTVGLDLGNGDRLDLQLMVLEKDRRIFSLLRLGRDVGGKGAAMIGRDRENEIVLPDSSRVSRRHARICLEADGWIIQSHGSNGLYRNGHFVEDREELSFGDRILIMGTEIIFLGPFLAYSQEENVPEKEDLILPRANLEPEVWSQEKCIFLPGAEESAQREREFHRSPRALVLPAEEEVEIAEPPDFREREAAGEDSFAMDAGASLMMAMPMLVSALFMLYAAGVEGQKPGLTMYGSLVMVGAAFFCSLTWAMISRLARERQRKKEVRRLQEDYQDYLRECDGQIRKSYENHRQILVSRYPSADHCVLFAGETSGLWSRNVEHKDFLHYRLGLGKETFSMEIRLPRKGFRREGRQVWKQIEQMKARYAVLNNVPILFNLADHHLVGVVSRDPEDRDRVLRLLVTQVAMTDSPGEVKLMWIGSGLAGERRRWDFLRWIPHVKSAEDGRRYLADNPASARDLLFHLDQIVEKRLEKAAGQEGGRPGPIPHYIVLVRDTRLILDGMTISKIISRGPGLGITLVWAAEELSALPNECRYVAEVTDSFQGIYRLSDMAGDRREVSFDRVEEENLQKFARSLVDLKVTELSDGAGLKESLTFFEMYGIHKAEELHIAKRWKENRARDGLQTLIGMREGGQACYLDIHEKYHGPHGLLAGTTGSGKSETLQTFILSIACNYSPEEISFFLIDYKGGGMAELFREIPHVAGLLSNLSGGLISRAMISINSEIRRRQRQFRKYKVNNIGAYSILYSAGRAAEPMPHLLIVIDEFAELKSRQPEFMSELVSVAQVGRSLGVHLLLSTQKPAGSVDENIWSNSHFHICLKVATRQDSLDMLHHPEAAYITCPGRGYLQVGNDELYEQFQSGWSGAPCTVEEELPRVEQVAFDGRAIPAPDSGKQGGKTNGKTNEKTSGTTNGKINGKEAWEIPSQLTAVKEEIRKVAAVTDYKPPASLWMQPLPTLYPVDLAGRDLATRPERLLMEVGLVDDPANQKQMACFYDLRKTGHILVCGGGLSGKSLLVQTLLLSLAAGTSPEDLVWYLVDFGGGGLKILQGLPHTGDYFDGREEDKLKRLMDHLKKEMERRLQVLGGMAFAGNSLPYLVLVIDGYDSFSEMTGGRYEQDLLKLSREGERAGMLLMVTAGSVSIGGLPQRIAANFKSKICLSMKDSLEYSEVMGLLRVPVEPEPDIPGRGLLSYQGRVLEFQSGICFPAESDRDRLEKIESWVREKDLAWTGRRPERIRSLPGKATWKLFRKELEELQGFEGQKDPDKKGADREVRTDRTFYPGYRIDTAEPLRISLEEHLCLPICSRTDRIRTNMCALFLKQLKGQDVYGILIDPRGDFAVCREAPGIKEYLVKEEEVFACFDRLSPMIGQRAESRKAGKGPEEGAFYCFLICDGAAFFQMIYQGTYEMGGFFENIFEKGEGLGMSFVMHFLQKEAGELEGYSAFRLMVSRETGLHVGGSLSSSPFPGLQNLSYEDQVREYKALEGCYTDEENDKVDCLIPEVEKDDYR